MRQCAHHCIGASRSATVVIGFLMHHLSIPFGVAFNQVICARPVVFPNKGFRAILVAETKTIAPTLQSPPVMAGNPFRQKKSSRVISKPPAILDMVWEVLDTTEQRRVEYHFSVASAQKVDKVPMDSLRPMTNFDRLTLMLFANKQRQNNCSSWSLLSKNKKLMRLIFEVT